MKCIIVEMYMNDVILALINVLSFYDCFSYRFAYC